MSPQPTLLIKKVLRGGGARKNKGNILGPLGLVLGPKVG